MLWCHVSVSLTPALIWTNENKPHDSGGVTWPSSSLPRGMLVGPTCQVCIVVGSTWLRWTNEVLPHDTLSLLLILYVYVCLRPPVCTQKCFYHQVVPREACDQISTLD
jgi:hypothetical protein